MSLEPDTTPSRLTILLREKSMKRFVRATIEVNTSTPANTVTKFEVIPVVTPLDHIPANDPRRAMFEKALQPLTPELRKKIVYEIVQLVNSRYPHPETSDTITTTLETHLQSGSYDTFTTSAAFSHRLSQDIKATTNDSSLWISFTEPPPQSLPSKNMGFDSFRSSETGLGQPTFKNTSKKKIIATLPISEFLEAENSDTLAKTSEIISRVADADLLVLNIRGASGRNFRKAAWILSFLMVDTTIELLRLVDKAGNVVETISTTALSNLPPNAKIYGGTKPIFIVTDVKTCSAGEFMVYVLKGKRNGVKVIGDGNETTMGDGAVMTHPEFVCAETFGEMWWLAAVPDRKVEGDEWEGGVVSDVIVEEGRRVEDVVAEMGERLLDGY
ncbi:putative Retinol-binding protein 3 [Glarea lozoyensis 74030]|nr:putative Retinol-binding protein 3 [Glarea lozoyensis 74030]